MASKINLSKAFDHEDPEEGQKIFEKMMTPELRHRISQHVSDHIKPPAKSLDRSQEGESWRSSPQASGGAQGETGESTGLP